MKLRPIPGEPTRWRVWSETREGVAYIVDREYVAEPGEAAAWACGCEQFMVRGLECKHIRAVKKLVGLCHNPK